MVCQAACCIFFSLTLTLTVRLETRSAQLQTIPVQCLVRRSSFLEVLSRLTLATRFGSKSCHTLSKVLTLFSTCRTVASGREQIRDAFLASQSKLLT